MQSPGSAGKGAPCTDPHLPLCPRRSAGMRSLRVAQCNNQDRTRVQRLCDRLHFTCAWSLWLDKRNIQSFISLSTAEMCSMGVRGRAGREAPTPCAGLKHAGRVPCGGYTSQGQRIDQSKALHSLSSGKPCASVIGSEGVQSTPACEQLERMSSKLHLSQNQMCSP